ncbi:hypothetical protein AB6A40_005197 [Gnathostoma spinigerum]|uniref:ADP-ribosylhydrolase ARH3 n=1 Tax=Gnathostoma spinigerum TaxID=75299 RepID=A0ABD6EER8_9BILA
MFHLRKFPVMDINKALGCLYGQLIGDALGNPYELVGKSEDVKALMKKDCEADGFLPIRGHITDDSQMALTIAESVCRNGFYDQADVACGYVRWAKTLPADIGNATKSALTIDVRLPPSWKTALDEDFKKCVLRHVLRNVKQYNQDSLSNGCLMRVSPLAIACASLTPDQMRTVVQSDTMLTHTNDVCAESVIAYSTAIRALLYGRSPKEAYDEALSFCRNETVGNLLRAAAEKAVPVKARDADVFGDTAAQGYVGVALQGAFYELLNAASFKDGLVETIGRGGDTDTNGCIAGALLGARFGVEMIPLRWKRTIHSAPPTIPSLELPTDIEDIAQRLICAIDPTKQKQHSLSN